MNDTFHTVLTICASKKECKQVMKEVFNTKTRKLELPQKGQKQISGVQHNGPTSPAHFVQLHKKVD